MTEIVPLQPKIYGKDVLFLRTAVAEGTIGSGDLEYEIALVNGHTPLVSFKDGKHEGRQYLYPLDRLVKDAYAHHTETIR